jgi:hypothetical protein
VEHDGELTLPGWSSSSALALALTFDVFMVLMAMAANLGHWGGWRSCRRWPSKEMERVKGQPHSFRSRSDRSHRAIDLQVTKQ